MFHLIAQASEAAQPWYVDILQWGALKYLHDGGFFMVPILFLGILAGGVVIERWRSLKLLTGDNRALRADVLDLLHADRVEEAYELCSRQRGPVAAILSAGLRKFVLLRRLGYDAAKIEEQVVKSMDDYGVHIVGALERHLPILATISAVAPMIGSLGTIWGMVILFRDVAEKVGTTNIVQLAAAGIQVKLLVTLFGLMVGIPSYTFYNYFTNVINRYVLDVEESGTELIEAVTLQLALKERTSTTAATQA